MDSQRSFLENQTLVEIDDNDWTYYVPQLQAQEYGQGYDESILEELQMFDFAKFLEETLAYNTKISEDQLEAEKAMATEKFLREAYDNLLNMECSPIEISGKEAQRLREETEKFLEDSYNNLLHMFDGLSDKTQEDCSPADMNGEEAKRLREVTDKFLEDSYNNLLHTFDGVSETGEGGSFV